jgi:UDP-N-acetylmuramate dehydrogenase
LKQRVDNIFDFPVRGMAYHQFPSKRLNTWQVGGVVRYYIQPADLEEACLLQHYLQNRIQVIWLGLGSNVLLPDGEIDVCIMNAKQCFIDISHQGNGQLSVGAGVTCAKVAKQMASLGFDASFLAGIPGTMGGAICMNAGCYGHQTWDFLQSVTLINQDFKPTTYPAAEIKWGYRQTDLPKHFGIIGGTFIFPSNPNASQAIKDLLKERNAAQPIGTANCGSVFKNPPNYAAAKLIDQCGLKGFCIGDACISNKHANFIENKGQATAAQMLALIEHIQSVVMDRFQIQLEPEVKMIQLK